MLIVLHAVLVGIIASILGPGANGRDYPQVAAPRNAFTIALSYEYIRSDNINIYFSRKIQNQGMEVYGELLDSFDQQLRDSMARIPKDKRDLIPLAIWIEWETSPKFRGKVETAPGRAKYISRLHERPDLLTNAKKGSIEIWGRWFFVAPFSRNPSFVILHEFAHAYHDQILGFDNKTIIDTYKVAMERGLYAHVKSISNSSNGWIEYLADLSVVYLAKWGWYPYSRNDLEKYDPLGFSLMKKIWDEPVSESRTIPKRAGGKYWVQPE